MPELCRFFGVVLAMYLNDHDPPHFHARYNEHHATIEIESLRISKGELPPRIYGFVVEWALQHKAELIDNWQRAHSKKPIKKIKPLQ
ncbi:DUF4160 domain-containing protein [bacterium]|nr:DUF4160 domain-containing protein [bacterium]